MKFSEEIGKITLPGGKSVLRVYTGDKPAFDLLCLDNEAESLAASSEIKYFKEKNLESAFDIINPTKIEILTVKLFEGGKRQLNLP